MAQGALRTACLSLVGLLVLGLGVERAAGQAPKTEGLDAKTPAADPPRMTGPTGFASIEDPTRIINAKLAEAWQANKLTPADRCSDYEFIRRASLDIIGRIAKVSEIEQFMKDPPNNRRAMLVDRLLKSDEYTSSWATMWTHWLMTRTGQRLYRDQMQLWLEEQFALKDPKDPVPSSVGNHKEMVEKLLTATGKTNDRTNPNPAVNYILAHLGESQVMQGRGMQRGDPTRIMRENGQFSMVPVTSRTVRIFLGYQIQCTQCHDHPFNADWKQSHFWGVNVFFRQVELVGTPPQRGQQPQMANTILELRDNPDFNTVSFAASPKTGKPFPQGIVAYEKRNAVFLFTGPKFIDGSPMPRDSKLTRREELAKFVVGHKNFSRAYVNRMWAHFFGRGMNVKPAADDFGEHNELAHEELLTKLGEAFAGSGAYDSRKLIRWICASDAYNLKCQVNKTNSSPETDPYFSRMFLKMMSPEQLLESLVTATKPGGAGNDADLKRNETDLRNQWMNTLVRNFGDDEGNEVTFNGTVVQALLMMNGRNLNEAISNKSGTVQEALKRARADDPQGKAVMDYIYLATLNRRATPKEAEAFFRLMKDFESRKKLNDPAGRLQDLFWACLNSNEFLLNH